MGMSHHSWPLTIRIIVFSCLIGVGAGVLGTALTTNYLSDYALQLSEVTQPIRLTQERPRALPKNYEDALVLLDDRALPTVGSLFSQASLGETGVSRSSSHIPVVMLTSDGWAIASKGAIGDLVHWQMHQCEIDQVVHEPRFGFEFIHCATSNAPVVNIADGYDIQLGDQLFVVSSSDDVLYTRVRTVVWGEAVASSDFPTRRILLTDAVPADVGSAVFNLYSELVGITIETDNGVVVLPFEHVSGAFKQVLESSTVITYPSLGVHGIDLARTVGVDKTISGSVHTGVMLYGARAIERGSSAQLAGLNVGDLILSVDGVVLNEAVSLDDLLAGYSAGDTASIGIERDGVQQELSVTLGELKL